MANKFLGEEAGIINEFLRKGISQGGSQNGMIYQTNIIEKFFKKKKYALSDYIKSDENRDDKKETKHD